MTHVLNKYDSMLSVDIRHLYAVKQCVSPVQPVLSVVDTQTIGPCCTHTYIHILSLSLSLSLLELRMMEVVMTTGTIRRTKLQSPPTKQHPTLYTLDALPITQPTVSNQKRRQTLMISTTCTLLVPCLLKGSMNRNVNKLLTKTVASYTFETDIRMLVDETQSRV